MGIINFYHCFVPRCAGILDPLHNLLKTSQKPFIWSPTAATAFQQAKCQLAEATLLNYPVPEALTSIMSSASDVAVGAVLQQFVDGIWKPISYFSCKLNPAETRYSTFDHELLLAIYLAIRHFVEGRKFHVLTDHKPLIYSLSTNSNLYSPQQVRHLDFISQFTSDIRHIHGNDNSVADALSHIDISAIHQLPPAIDFSAIATAQKTDTELQQLHRFSTSLKFVDVPVPDTNLSIVCDFSTGISLLYLPVSFRGAIFEVLHGLSHLGIRATQRLITTAYVWPKMKKDIQHWTRSCLHCQLSKIQQHYKAPPPSNICCSRCAFRSYTRRHRGSPSRGCNYLFTCIDRFTRWTEAIPIPDITSKTVAHALLSGWISQFRTPITLTSDRGRQFESNMWKEHIEVLNTIRSRNISYHPATNGIVERFHHQLKASLKCHSQPEHWADFLPLVMLGIRTSLKEDLGCSTAEIVYGTTLRLPGMYFSITEDAAPDVTEYVQSLKAAMQKLQPTPPRQSHCPPCNVNPALQSQTHVFIR